MNKVRLVTAVLTTLVLAATPLAAQMGRGRVAGTVKDTEGNIIAGAAVAATLPSSGAELATTTDDKGRWSLLGFVSGTYDFNVSAEGFRTYEYKAPVKQSGRNPPMNVVLERVQTGQAAAAAGSNALLQEANALFEQKDFAGAIAKYQELLNEEPSLYQLHLSMGAALLEMGELDKATAEYELVLEQEPTHAGALVSLGDIMVQKGDLNEAVVFFEKAIAESTQDEILPFNVAEIYFQNGNTDGAIEYYQKASEIKPDWPDPYLKLGLTYLNKGDLDSAATAFQKVLEVAPESPTAQSAQAFLDQLGKD